MCESLLKYRRLQTCMFFRRRLRLCESPENCQKVLSKTSTLFGGPLRVQAGRGSKLAACIARKERRGWLHGLKGKQPQVAKRASHTPSQPNCHTTGRRESHSGPSEHGVCCSQKRRCVEYLHFAASTMHLETLPFVARRVIAAYCLSLLPALMVKCSHHCAHRSERDPSEKCPFSS